MLTKKLLLSTILPCAAAGALLQGLATSLRAAPGPGSVPAAKLTARVASQSCQGEVIIALDENGMPTGAATHVCTEPCEEGCVSYFITIVGPNNSYDAAACGCSSIGGPNLCCQTVLTPPSGNGTGMGYGACGVTGCPSGNKCVSEQGVGAGSAGENEWGAFGKCKLVVQPR